MRFSEADYRSTYLEPKVLEPLGFPYRDIAFVRRESSASYVSYKSKYFLDYLFLVDDKPALVIEAKAEAKSFDSGFDAGLHHARNYDPARTIPFLLVAAGEQVEMFEAHAAGLTIEFRKLEKPLAWAALCERVRGIYAAAPAPAAAANPAAAPVFANIFADVFAALKRSGRPKFGDEAAVAVLNRLVLAEIYRRRGGVDKVLSASGVPSRVAAEVREVLGRYDLAAIEGDAAAYAYRQFVAAYFRGYGSTAAGKKDLERTGRYLTPVEIISFMVALAAPGADDRIIDPACGSGGFLGGVLARIPESDRIRFAERNLFACEVDAFCADAARTFVELMLPGEQANLNIFHHNGLYAGTGPGFGDISKVVAPGFFDLVIGNPPANAAYSGGEDAAVVARALNLPAKFTDADAFLRRALELCAPGGRVCLVVPDGALANMGRDQELRNSAQEKFAPRAIVSLPRVFPAVSSKMSILYLEHVTKRLRKKPVFMARVELGPDPATGEERILGAELDALAAAFKY